MSGKIFSESANVSMDQAKILFDYYRAAAEKIVNEEEEVEKKISSSKEFEIQIQNEIKKSNTAMMGLGIAGAVIIIIGAFAGTALIIIGIIGLLSVLAPLNQLKQHKNKLILNGAEIQRLLEVHKSIFRDYKVTKLGLGYVPVAGQIAFEDKSFLIDYTGSKENEKFILQTLKEGELFAKKINELEGLIKECPIVEKSKDAEEVETDEYSTSIQKVVYHDYLGGLDRNLRTSTFYMDDLDVASVSLPVVLPESEYAKYLNEFSTTEISSSPVFETFDTGKYAEDLDKFKDLNDMKKSLERHSVQFEDVLKNLIVRMADAVQTVTKLKMASSSKLTEQSNQLLFKILKVSYNHYSPILEAEEIERIRMESFDFSESVENYQPFQLKKSSLVKYDLVNNSWVAEDNSKTNFPFGVHQIHEEIVAPIVQNLMMETRIERLKIYNKIKDQKIDYLNKWHQDTEDFYGRNRAESNDLINIMRATLSQYVAAFNTLTALENTESSMSEGESMNSTIVKSESKSAEVFAAFDIKAKEFQKIQTEFAEYMERLKEDIENRAKKFEHIEYYEASLRDGSSRDMAVSSSNVNELEPRRKALIAVNPFYAETSELPAPPSIEAVTYDHMALNLSAVAKNILTELENELLVSKLDETKMPVGSEFTPASLNDSEGLESEITDKQPEAKPADNEVGADMSESESLETTAINLESIASEYKLTLQEAYPGIAINVIVVSLIKEGVFDGIRIECFDEEIKLESGIISELASMDVSDKEELAWSESEDENGQTVFTLDILLIS